MMRALRLWGKVWLGIVIIICPIFIIVMSAIALITADITWVWPVKEWQYRALVVAPLAIIAIIAFSEYIDSLVNGAKK